MREMRRMHLWVAIDPKDPYKRVVAVADTTQELAKMLGISRKAIYVHRNLAKNGKVPEKYLKIEIPEDDDIQELKDFVEYARDTSGEIPDEDWTKYQAIFDKNNPTQNVGSTPHKMLGLGGRENGTN